MSDVAASGFTEEQGRIGEGLLYRHWKPAGSLRGVILLVHGLGEHGGRYRSFAEVLGQRGYAVVAPDHIGHGESPGRRVYVKDFSDYTVPLDTLRAMIDEWYPDLPCFLIGHSMGGLISSRYLLDHQAAFAGAALSGAALEVSEEPPPLQLGIISALSSVWPSLGVMQLDATQVSRDPAVVEDYLQDPLVAHGKVTARLVSELFRVMAEVKGRRAEITLPILVMHGDQDGLAATTGSEHLYAAVGSTDRTLRIYPGLYHEIFNEPERLQVIGELADWLDARCLPSE